MEAVQTCFLFTVTPLDDLSEHPMLVFAPGNFKPMFLARTAFVVQRK